MKENADTISIQDEIIKDNAKQIADTEDLQKKYEKIRISTEEEIKRLEKEFNFRKNYINEQTYKLDNIEKLVDERFRDADEKTQTLASVALKLKRREITEEQAKEFLKHNSLDDKLIAFKKDYDEYTKDLHNLAKYMEDDLNKF